MLVKVKLEVAHFWWLTLEVVTFSIHENVVDQDDTEDAGPQMNVTEHQHESNVLQRERVCLFKSWLKQFNYVKIFKF